MKPSRTMASQLIYIACAWFLKYAGALASNKTDAKCLNFQTKKTMFFARISDSHESNSFNLFLFQIANMYTLQLSWSRQRACEAEDSGSIPGHGKYFCHFEN